MFFTRITLFIFIFAALFLAKHLAHFLMALFSKDENVVKEYKITKVDYIHIGVAIAYVLTFIITGFTL